MSNYPTSSADDAASISNQPLIPKTSSEPKNYEEAAASLMSSYGFSGGMQATPIPPKKSKKNKMGRKKKNRYELRYEI